MGFVSALESELVGKKITSVSGHSIGSNEVMFLTEDGLTFRFSNSPHYSSGIFLNLLEGDTAEFICSAITSVDIVNEFDKNDISITYKTYKLQTDKARLLMCWTGVYSESYDEFETYYEGVKLEKLVP